MRFDLTYRLSEAEFMVACNDLWAHKAIDLRGNLITAVVLLLLGLILFWQGVPGLWGWVLVLGAIGIVAMTAARDRFWRRYYRQTPKFAGAIHAQFSDEGITVQSQEGESELAWSHFRSFLPTKKAFLLVINPRHFSIIPHSAFDDELHMLRFEGLLVDHLNRLPRRYL